MERKASSQKNARERARRYIIIVAIAASATFFKKKRKRLKLEAFLKRKDSIATPGREQLVDYERR